MDSGNVIGWIGLGATVLGNFAILVKMYTKVNELDAWKAGVEQHMKDSEKHLDPRRDGWRWDGFEKRLDRIERKLDTVVAMEQDNKKHKKGDSDDY